ncbi:MAG: cation transporting ATPase C-terminal domain-containing protein, partial [Sterolibacterium sp.]|nr:cation transporting ATPase C-terminal domain-containing protein [Sterolibacterium sp.]
LLAIAACIPLQLAYTYLPLLQTIFGSADLSPSAWLKIIAASLLVFFGAELEKALMRRTRFPHPATGTMSAQAAAPSTLKSTK